MPSCSGCSSAGCRRPLLRDSVDLPSIVNPIVLYRLLRRIVDLVGCIPIERHARIATLLGGILFRLARRHRRIALANLEIAFGSEKTPAQIHAIARKVFDNMVRVILEFGWSQKLDDLQYRRFFTLSGIEAYRQAASKGKGVLALLAHFGNWELLPIVAHMAQMPASLVYRPLDAQALDRFLMESRRRHGARTISNRRGAMRRIYQDLKEGRTIGMLMDQNVAWYEGAFVDFLRRSACTSTGMAMLALKTGAPVLPLFLLRSPTGFDVLIGPELPLIRSGDRTKDIEANTQLYNRVIEIYVRHFPEQWFWVHQRWKTRPWLPWPNPQRRARWLAKQRKSKRR